MPVERSMTRRETLAGGAALSIVGLTPLGVSAVGKFHSNREAPMPLIRFDIYEGRSDQEIETLLDASHRAMVAAFEVPERDRYQIVNEHRPSRMIVQDTGLDIPRTRNFVMMQVTTRPRSREMKEKFYKLTVEELEKSCAIAPSDVMMNFVTCTDEDWSFGLGRAQFLTKEL